MEESQIVSPNKYVNNIFNEFINNTFDEESDKNTDKNSRYFVLESNIMDYHEKYMSVIKIIQNFMTCTKITNNERYKNGACIFSLKRNEGVKAYESFTLKNYPT